MNSRAIAYNNRGDEIRQETEITSHTWVNGDTKKPKVSEFEKLKALLPSLPGIKQHFELFYIRQKKNDHSTLRYAFAQETYQLLKEKSDFFNDFDSLKSWDFGGLEDVLGCEASVRSLRAALFYKKIGLSDKHFWLEQFPMVVETMMTILYYENQILDRKSGVVTHTNVCDNLHYLLILKEALNQYIELNISVEFRASLRQFVSENLQTITIGQLLQREMNTYEHWKYNIFERPELSKMIINQAHDQERLDVILGSVLCEIEKISPEIVAEKGEYLKSYLTRIYLTNSLFFMSIVDFQSNYGLIDRKEYELLMKTVGIFGIMHQLINDEADFLLPSSGLLPNTKKEGDHLKDVENNIITLAVAIHLHLKPNGCLDQFFNSTGTSIHKIKIIDEHKDRTASSPLLMSKITSALKRATVSNIGELGLSKKTSETFESRFEVGESNKYYRYYRDKGVL